MPAQRHEGPWGNLVLITRDHESGTRSGTRAAGSPSPHGPFPAIAAGSGPCRLGPASDGPPSAEQPARRRVSQRPAPTEGATPQGHDKRIGGKLCFYLRFYVFFFFFFFFVFVPRKPKQNRENQIRPQWLSLVATCVRPQIWRRSAAPSMPCRACPRGGSDSGSLRLPYDTFGRMPHIHLRPCGRIRPAPRACEPRAGTEVTSFPRRTVMPR